jgi:hypothetical protein
MKREILIAALVVLAGMPVATAYAAPTNSPPVDAASATPAESDGATNFTKLYVNAEDSYLDIKPGESASFTVRVKNGEDRALDVNPHLFTSPVAEYPLESEWVTIDGPDTLEAGQEVEYEVTVEVPEEAESASYRGQVAFTNETTATRPGRPERPVHADYVRVEVWRPPTVKILSDTYLSTQVEAGDTVTRQIVIKNTGDEAVPLSPELGDRGHSCHGPHCENQLDPNWVDIDAPNQVQPGETATVTVSISPDEAADRGRYRTSIDLGLKDPNRDPRRDYWQQVNMNFVVWKQPSEPYEHEFEVTEETENVTLTLSPRTAGDGERAEEPSFDVTFVSPDGERIEAERVEVSERGFVDLGSRERGTSDGDYTTRRSTSKFVYVLDAPETGEWTVEIMPDNTIGFQYELTRNESGD